MPIQTLFAAATVLLALFFSTESRAEPRARDGFFLQLTAGVGAPRYASTAQDPFTDPPLAYTDHQSGEALTGSLLLGAPLRPGLVLGAGGLLLLSSTSGPNRTENGMPVTWEDSGGPYLQLVGIVGPFLDFYPSSASGWHLQALVGYATFGHGDIASESPSGVGLMAGIGHDWWFTDHWSVGALARIAYASTRLGAQAYPDGLGGRASEQDTLLSPSLEVTFTFH